LYFLLIYQADVAQYRESSTLNWRCQMIQISVFKLHTLRLFNDFINTPEG